MLRVLLDKLWNEDIWLPPNTTWADVTPGPYKEVVYTDHRHVWFPIPFAVVLLIIRYALEKKIFAPLGRQMGVSDTRRRKAPDNPKLEAAYRDNPKLNQFRGLAKQLDMTERQVERWWRLRRSQDKPSTLVKFCESMFKATYFTCQFPIGLMVLWDKAWLWDIDYAYIGYPHQSVSLLSLATSWAEVRAPMRVCVAINTSVAISISFAIVATGITNDVWWYLMMCWALSWSQIMTQFWDVKRKDFWQYIVHHFATIMLLQISWVCNLHRIGSLVIVSHDSSEIFLESAKAMKYAKYQRTCDCLFVVFILLWFVSRLGYFPFYIIWSALFRAPVLMAMTPMAYILIFLLCILLGLHIVWTWFILQVAYGAVISGQMEGDIRSSSSDFSDIDQHLDQQHQTITCPNLRVN